MSRAAEIVFDRVTKRYAGRDAAALQELSFEIPAGTFCVLVGPSGGGKTTALKLVNRLIDFDEGDIRIESRATRGERTNSTSDTGTVASPALRGEYPASCCRKMTRKNVSVESAA